MSTNVKTKKYDMLEKQSGVALLIHDFAEQGGEYSITLNGNCSVVKDGKQYEPTDHGVHCACHFVRCHC